MARFRIWITALLLLSALAFIPRDAQSKQYFDATLRFNPESGSRWHYLTDCVMVGDEIEPGRRSRVGGMIRTIYDEEVNSSGSGLVSTHVRFNTYESLDTSWANEWEDPGSSPWTPPDFGAPQPDEFDLSSGPGIGPGAGGGDPMQSIGGDPPGGGGGGGDEDLQGEGAFEVTPIMESNLNYTMSESGRILDLSGLDIIGDIIDPSRSITVRQVFQTVHFVVLPDYEVHLNESWRAPMSWTIPFVGETMEIPLTFTLADIRTAYRFRMAAIDFSGILQFDVDTSDENMTERKESNIEGDIIIQGRAYVDLDRGILVAIADTPAFGPALYVDGWAPGGPYGSPNPGFFATLNFERRDLYIPLGNVIDTRQEVIYRIQELAWFTTTVVE